MRTLQEAVVRSLIILVAILALAACQDRTASTQKEIKDGVNEDRIAKRKITESLKQGEAARREGDAAR